MAFNPSGTRLATGSEVVRIWDTATWQCLHTWNEPTGRFDTLAYDDDGKMLTATHGYTTYILDADTGKLLTSTTATATEDTPYRAPSAHSADGTRVATCLPDGTIQISDTATGLPVMMIGLAWFKPLELPGYASWDPATNELLHIEGEAWRCVTKPQSGAPAVPTQAS